MVYPVTYIIVSLIAYNCNIILLPLADTGDCSDEITVTFNGLLDVPPASSNVIVTNFVASKPVYCVCVNLTLISE